MNRALLTCIFLAIPSLGAAAPCDILPYANQCQGSNLWPVPAGWAADNNGDCQPQPGYEPAVLGYGMSTQARVFPTLAEKLAELSSIYSREITFKPHGVYTIGQQGPGCADPILLTITSVNGMAVYRMTGLNGCGAYEVYSVYGDITRNPICEDTAVSLEFGVAGDGVSLAYLDWQGIQRYAKCRITSKAANGVCTARWTSSAQTALQKDPLDPDCDAGSCVFDGTCRLR